MAARSEQRDGRATVVLADHNALYRAGMARAISRHHGLDLVGETADGLGALALIEGLEPDVALVDVRIPALRALEARNRRVARTLAARTKVVLLATFSPPMPATRMLAAGAVACLAKAMPRAEICRALLALARQQDHAAGVEAGPAGADARLPTDAA